MRILSHRGCWKDTSERNTEVAFRRSFSLGFGTETDVRDYNETLVISHDIPTKSCMKLEDFFRIYKSYEKDLPLALNVKSDGLQLKLKSLLNQFEISNYFVFDMSVPDAIIYLREELNSFTRQSEYEMSPSFFNDATGLWLDEFYKHWVTNDIIQEYLLSDKKVCIVSPDLHKRSYLEEWKQYRIVDQSICSDDLMICTDHPEEAREFFNE